MSNEAALIAAIRANPSDRTLPLILADFFDENDDPRGQWIRNYRLREWMRPDYQSPVPKLLEALAKDKRVLEVRGAARVIGEPIVPGLVELLKHAKPRVRQQACLCLRAIGPRAKAAVPALIERMSDEDSTVCSQAAKALKDIGADASADADKLKGALTADNWAVRRAASTLIGKMGARESVLEQIVERFDSPQAADRVASAQALGELGTAEVIPHLAGCLKDRAPSVVLAAIRALGGLKLAAAVPPLLAAFEDSEAEVRLAAVNQFNDYGRDHLFTDGALAALAARLKDRSAAVREEVCRALWRYEKRAAAIAPALIEALADKSPEVRRRAADAVAVACPTPAAAAALLPLVSDEVNMVASGATSALSSCSDLPREFAEPLMAYVRRARAANTWELPVGSGLAALGRLADPPASAVKVLRSALNGDNRWDAFRALSQLGPAAEAALPELFELLDDENCQSEALRTILRIGGPAFARFTEILDGPETPLRDGIVSAIWREESALPLVPALVRLFRRIRNDDKRSNVLYALRGLGPKATEAIPLFVELLESSPTSQFRDHAIDALQPMGAPLVPYLERLAPLPARPGYCSHRSGFARLFASLAADNAVAFEALRGLLRLEVPTAGTPNDNWYARHWHTNALCQALRGLRALREKAVPAVPDAIPLVAHESSEVCLAALDFFSAVGAPAAAPALCAALASANEVVRAKAVEALARQGAPSDDTLNALAAALEDRAVKVRRAAVETLNKLGTSSPSVLAALEAATEDADAKVKERAAVALRKLTPKAEKPTAARAKPKKKPR